MKIRTVCLVLRYVDIYKYIYNVLILYDLWLQLTLFDITFCYTYYINQTLICMINPQNYWYFINIEAIEF